MADVVYRVVIDLATKGDLGAGAAAQAQPKFAAVRDTISKISDNAKSMASTVSSSLASVGSALGDVVQRTASAAAGFAKWGAVAALGAVTYGILGVNNELERTQIALGAIFKANGVASTLPAGMSIAKDVMSDMRRDAASLPGTFKDLTGIFKTIAIPGLHAGGSVDDLRKLSGNTMAVGHIAGLPMEQTARELAMLIEGRAGSHNVLGMRLASLGGDKAEHFNHLAAPERLKVLTAEIGKYQDAIEEYKKSFDGVSSTFRDNARQFIGLATAPLFDRIKDSLSHANAWLDDHKDKVAALAKAIGDKLGAVWDWVAAKIEKIGSFFSRLSSGGGAGAGGDSASGGGNMGLAGAALGPVLAALLGAAGPLVPILSLLAAGMSVVANTAHDLHGEAVKAWSGIREGFAAIMPSVGSLMSNIGKLAETLGVLLLNAINDVLPVCKVLVDALSFVVEAFTDLAGRLGPIARDLFQIVTLGAASTFDPEVVRRRSAQSKAADIDSARYLGKNKYEPASTYHWTDVLDDPNAKPPEPGAQWNYKAIDDLIAIYRDGKASGKIDEETLSKIVSAVVTPLTERNPNDPLLALLWQGAKFDPTHRRPEIPAGGAGGGGVHIHNVYVTVSQNNDPNRIARVIGGHLSDMARFRKSSPYTPNFSAYR